MITLKDFMECIDYKITEGSDYMWGCYGPNAHQLDCWNGMHDDTGYTVNVVFDTKDQTVYEMEAWDYGKNRQYRWINPNYLDEVKAEYKSRGLDFRTSLDDGTYIDLETADDMLEKARAIAAGETYDTRIKVPIDLNKDELFLMMQLAHEEDITLNELFAKALLAAIDKHKAEHDNA